jgi:uncharacterized protein YndB with AHSA1/START domain
VTNPTTITAEPGLPFVDIVREFNAPAAAVFRAHTDRDLYARWLGPAGSRLDLVEYDATVGGRWRYVTYDDGDHPYGFFGVFHAVEPDHLLIQTFEFEGAPGAAGISITTFTETAGRTQLAVREVYPSVEARDMAMASGMDSGVKEGYDRLEALIAA